MLVQKVQYNVRIYITAQLNTDSHTLAVRFIAEVCNAVNLFISDKFCNLLNQSRLIDHVRKFCHDDAVLAVYS